MAKRKAARRTQIIVARPMPQHHAPPRPIVIRQVKAPKLKHHRRGRHHSKGFGEKHRAIALVGAAVLGFLDKSSFALPTLPFLGKAGTAGVAAWAVGKYMHSPLAEDMATGMLSIAVYELVKDGKIAGVGEDEGYVVGGL